MQRAGRGRALVRRAGRRCGLTASGGQRARHLLQPGFGEEPGGAAGRAPAALGDVGDQQPVLGAGGGDVEQPALLGQPLRVR